MKNNVIYAELYYSSTDCNKAMIVEHLEDGRTNVVYVKRTTDFVYARSVVHDIEWCYTRENNKGLVNLWEASHAESS